MWNTNEDMELRYVSNLYDYANERPKRLSWVVFIFLSMIVVAFFTWTALAKVDEIAKGDGKVIPYGKVQTIQSYDGGIVSDILVKEGAIVEMGTALLKVDTTRFQASLEENLQKKLSLMAKKARLEAESNININRKVSQIVFEKALKEDNSRYDLSEQQLFERRFNELKSSVLVLKNQLGQKQQELKEIQSTIKNLEQNLIYIRQQRKTLQKLVRSKIKSNYELLDLDKELNQTRGDLQTAKLSAPRSKLAIQEAKHRIDERINVFKSKAVKELNAVIEEMNKLEAILVSETDKVDKTVIKSPVKGIIKNIYTNTIGGVIQPGMDIAEVVPISESLLVEAKIDPKDIAFINPSQKSIVKLTAYDFSIYGGLEAEIIEISADSIVDKESKEGRSYYRVLVKTQQNYLEKDGRKLPIIPGMVAQVDIITGKKTILDFILKPILKVKQNAFHER